MTPRKRKILTEVESEERLPVSRSYKDTGDRINQRPPEIRFLSIAPSSGNPTVLPAPLENADSPDPYREIPIVVVSNEVGPDMMDRVKALQIEHVIGKPYNSEFLRKNVNTLLEIDKKKAVGP